MKLNGNSGKKKKRPNRYNVDSYEETRRRSEREPDEKRTPEERAQIDRMIARYQKIKWRRRIIIISVILILAAAGFILWKSLVRPPEVPAPTPEPTTSANLAPGTTPKAAYNRKPGVYTIALFGKDFEAGLTDTIMIGTFDTENHTLNVVNIPRDTLINVKRDYKKANGMYSHNSHDMDKVKAELKDLLGYAVDSYIVVDIKAFEKVVDTIEGVDFDVPVNMDYDDEVQNFSVHLNAGYQHLDGAKALGVVRFRQNNADSPYGVAYPRADIDRIATQQAFMKTVAKKCLSIGNVTKVNDFVQIFKDYIVTDLSVGNMVWYGQEFLKLKNEDIHFMTLPENYDDFAMGMNCCVIDLEKWLDMINANLNPFKEKIKSDSLNVLTRNSKGVLYSTSGKINE